MPSDAPMRVLFLTHNFPRHAGDASGSFVLRLAVALRDEGIEAHVVAPAGPSLPERQVLEGVEVRRFRYAPRKYETLAYTGNMAADVQRSWSARFAMASFLATAFAAATTARRELQPALIHAHWWFPSGVVADWAARLGHLPMVTTLHGSDVRIARRIGAAQAPFRRVLRRSAVVTAVSSWLANEARRVDATRDVEVAPMPVRTDRFAPGTAPRHSDRLLFVGRLNAQKGIEHLLRALPLMRQPVRLDVVGDGPDGAAFRALVASLGVADRVRWMNNLQHEDLPGLYQRATALVMPSIEEGLGLVAVEAHLCATPVVGTDSGGLPDVVRHEQTGLLVPPADPAALARALDDLLSRPDRGQALGEAGRLHALSRFSPEAAAKRYASLYRIALAGD